MALDLEKNSSSCDCDHGAGGHSLISIEDALSSVAEQTSVVSGTDTVNLSRAKGRILSTPVSTKSNLPPFDNSAMDGYALNTEILNGEGPWKLEVIDRIPAGQTGQDFPTRNGAVRIFTGAPLPQTCNAVVKQEDVLRDEDTIILTKRPQPGTNVRFAGEECMAGHQVLPAGTKMDDRAVATCAASGNGIVKVTRKLRITLVVTGDEIRDARAQIGGAGIWDVNSPMLCAAMGDPFVDIQTVRFCPDDRLALTSEFNQLAETSDLIVTTGAVSVGEEDHARPAFIEAGGEIIFNGVAMKPGKPVSFGRIGNALWLGLPGNPLSAYVVWRLFGTTLCNRLAGKSQPEPVKNTVQLGNEINHRQGRTELRLATITRVSGSSRTIVNAMEATHSGRVTQLPMMDGLVVIPADASHLPTGSVVDFLPFSDC